MRELKVFAVVVIVTLITYWGVEPFAHSQMHP
ncbi:MAG: cytochrome c1, partial [Arcobacteraceae bacterium]|nr:cytochrome c1 [Arcobacteraceae bacterium]